MKSRVSLIAIILFMVTLLPLGQFTSLHAAEKTRPVEKLVFPPLNSFVLPEILKDETSNGMKLRLIKDDRLPIVTLNIILKGGIAYEPQSKIGLASATAQLLRIGGTKDILPTELDKQLDSNGISINFNADIDSFNISLSCLKENLDNALGLLSKMVMEPAFNKEKWEEVKAQMVSNIARRNEQPQTIRDREADRLFYGTNSPFASMIEYEHVDNISGEDLVRIYKQFFAPDNMLTGVIGPIEMPELKQLIEKYFGTWNAKAKIPAFPTVTEPTHDFKVAFIEKSDLNQSYITVGHLGKIDDLAEKAKINMFNSIFSRGFSSRLVMRVRVKMGSTYGVSGGISTHQLYPGLTDITTYTKSESTVDVIKAIFEEMDLIRKSKVTTQELEDARTYFQNSFVFNYSSPAQILMEMLRKEFYGIPFDADQKLLEDIKKVTADDVLATAQKYLTPEKMLVVVVGSKAALKADISQFGPVKDIDITIKPQALKEKIPAATPETLAKGQALISALAAKTYKGFTQLKSLYSEGSMQISMQGQTITMGLKATQLFPDKQLVEISVMGMKMNQIFNGSKGMMEQMGKKMPIPADRMEKEKFAEFYNIFTAKNVYSFQYLKEEQIDGKTFDVIYVFDAKQNWMKLFVNKATNYIEMEESLSEGFGQSGIGRKVYSDFRMVGTIPFAYKQVTFIQDKNVNEVTFTKIEANLKVDPAIFTITLDAEPKEETK